MYLFIHNLAILNFERIQVNALMKRENSIADGGVISQTQIFLRGARGRSRMTMPVGKNLQAFTSRIPQCRKLVLWRKREMFWRVVDILHPVVLRHDVALLAASTQQVTARLIRCVLLGLSCQFINNGLWNNHCQLSIMLKVASGLFVVYQAVDGGVAAADGTRVAMPHGNRAEQHGLGIEGKQTVRE